MTRAVLYLLVSYHTLYQYHNQRLGSDSFESTDPYIFIARYVIHRSQLSYLRDLARPRRYSFPTHGHLGLFQCASRHLRHRDGPILTVIACDHHRTQIHAVRALPAPKPLASKTHRSTVVL